MEQVLRKEAEKDKAAGAREILIALARAETVFAPSAAMQRCIQRASPATNRYAPNAEPQ